MDWRDEWQARKIKKVESLEADIEEVNKLKIDLKNEEAVDGFINYILGLSKRKNMAKNNQVFSSLSTKAHFYMWHIVMDYYAKGYKKNEIAMLLTERWDVTLSGAGSIIRDAEDYMIASDKEWAKNVTETLHLSVLKILKDSMETDDKKTALKAIDMLNKMTGQYTEKVEVKTDEPIKITFN